MSVHRWSVVPLFAALATPAIAQDANSRIDALETRIAELEAQQKAPASAPGGEAMTWKDFSALGSRFQIYGFLRADAYYDDSRPNSVTLPAFIRTEDQTAPASVRAPQHEDDFTIQTKLTRFGINFKGPEIGGLGDPKVSGKLETDFYNATGTDSREALRIRVAYLTLQWDHFAFQAGQMWDVISPLFPVVNPDNVMWFAGNLGDRRPQVRGDLNFGESTRFDLQVMAGNTGAIDAQDAEANGFKDGDQSGVPTLQARAAVSTPMLDWKKNVEFGIWAHRAKEQTDTPVAGTTNFNSSAYGIDLQVPVYQDRVWFKGEYWMGRNLGDVRGGIVQDINGNGKPIRSQGGFAEFGVKTCDHIDVYAGYSFDNPNNDDLQSGVVFPATAAARTRNSVAYAAIRCKYSEISFGLDYLRWVTGWQGFSDGTDNRLQAFIAYAF
jgi:hypothetical protein